MIEFYDVGPDEYGDPYFYQRCDYATAVGVFQIDLALDIKDRSPLFCSVDTDLGFIDEDPFLANTFDDVESALRAIEDCVRGIESGQFPLRLYQTSEEAYQSARTAGFVPATDIEGVPDLLIRRFCKPHDEFLEGFFNCYGVYEPEEVLATFGLVESNKYEADPAAIAALEKSRRDAEVMRKLPMDIKLQYQLSNGRWTDCGERSEEFLLRCERYTGVDENGKRVPRQVAVRDLTREEVIETLLAGETLRNDASDWYSNCRSGTEYEQKMAARREEQEQVEMVKCDCGHTVPRSVAMSASLGITCPDCYDDWS